MLLEIGKDLLWFGLNVLAGVAAVVLDIVCNSMFIYLCRMLLITVDIFCNLVYPAYETLFFLAKFRRKETYNAKFTHWTTYWIFYSVLHYVAKLLYFFPFVYEIKVMIVLLMAHPKVEAASLIQQFFVTNPIIMIQVIDQRNRLRNKLEHEWLPALKSFQLSNVLRPINPSDSSLHRQDTAGAPPSLTTSGKTYTGAA